MNRISSNPPAFAQNNFDLVRLFAALQTLAEHGTFFILICRHDAPELPLPLRHLLDFHGVAIFFVISGYLVTASWERTQNHPIAYIRNRILRIYPALWFCLALSVLLILFLRVQFTIPELLRWLTAHATVFQPYNPEFFRNHGVGALKPGIGTINGALWTITVELQFYIVFPFLYIALKKLLRNRDPGRLASIATCAAFALFGYLFVLYAPQFAPASFPILSYYSFTFIPHFYLFLFGWALRKNFDWLAPILRGKAIYWIIAYCLLIYLSRDANVLSFTRGNTLTFNLQYPLLGIIAVSAAYTFPSLAHKLLRGNDISYGIYIYHMPILALFAEYQWRGWLSYPHFLAFTLTTVAVASFSWFYIERPALSFKNRKKS